MKKFLVTIEFRYSDQPNSWDSTCRNKINTIGVFENIDDAVINANNVLIELEKDFSLNPNYNIKKRLDARNTLISNLGYIITPFEFYLKITTLNHTDIREDIKEAINSQERYKAYKNSID